MLEIKNLSKQYDGRVIFKNLDLTVGDGEVLSIVGPSGIGKTTLLRIIAGLLPGDTGSMVLDGKDLTIAGDRTGADVGVIFQDFNLFPQFTVMENIMLAPTMVHKESKQEAQATAADLVKQLGLTEQAELYPYQLSGGQRQRVAIARALAMKPGILAYDEPTSGLDEESTQRVVEIIRQLKGQGVTQLIVTHDLPFAEEVADETFDFGTDAQR
jgi:polar amino acid transport system ATP-binding protein